MTKTTNTAAAATTNTAAAEPKAPSKKAQATAIYTAGIAAGKSRKDIIAQFKTELSMSDAGATTYFQNCRAAAGLVTPKAAAEPVAEAAAEPVAEAAAEPVAEAAAEPVAEEVELAAA